MFFLFHIITPPVEEPRGHHQTQRRPGQVQLNDGPYPQAPQRRRLLLRRQVALRVGDVDEGAAGHDAHDEEDELAQAALEMRGQAGYEGLIRLSTVQRPKEQHKH